ncbi:hypothetical protein GL213_03390 [Halogeometricum borinquense]|uniref:hypothetical protein n=1 Tax=Halogeometricum borinquense TaxID=60847 RepID=UPI001425EDF4|nr:hypothetical protein [Halogeometricum borinquense]QIQ75656.1 hypothetical protein GL213_03390 [Halogeometricum borinquense]
MEQFVQLLVAGGVTLVTGLWTVTLLDSGSLLWAFGVVLVVAGVGGLADGIWRNVEY